MSQHEGFEISTKRKSKSKQGRQECDMDPMVSVRNLSKGKKITQHSVEQGSDFSALWASVRKRFCSTLGKGKDKSREAIIHDYRSLYLCFGEYDEGSKVSYVILSVNLHDMFSASPSRKLQLVAQISGDNLPRYMGCGVFESRILLGGGAIPGYRHHTRPRNPVAGGFCHHPVRKIYSVEPDSDPDVPVTSTDGTGKNMIIPIQEKKMLKGNVQPLLVELGGKLYALGKSLPSASFEMFDPSENKWSSLADPPHGYAPCYPFTKSDPSFLRDTYFAIAGTNILVSDNFSTYRFNTADPNQGWRRLERFSFEGTSLVVDDGRQYVLFTFKPSDGHHISVHLISYGFDSILRDYRCVPLPPNFTCKPDHLGVFPLSNYSLVQLGDEAVCLLVSHRCPSTVGNVKTFRCIESVGFTFKVIDKASAPLKIKIKFLPPAPVLIYDGDDDNMDSASSATQMLGAFLL